MKLFIIAFILSGISFGGGFAQTKDETSIKAVIEKETKAFTNVDVEGMISCWANVPYAYSLVYYGSGIFYETNANLDLPTRYRTIMKGRKPDGSTFSNVNYVIHINQNSAFAYFEQIITATDMSKTYAHEVRNLEKINGEWKIIYVGAVFFTPEKK